jgi:diguanylate cyclase (GGDEF)-like protein
MNSFAQGNAAEKPVAASLPLLHSPFAHNKACEVSPMDDTTPRASYLMREAPSIEANMPLLNVYDTFKRHAELLVLPVVNPENKPVGLINRNKLHEMFSQPFTRELHGRKPISHYMVDNPVIVDKDVSIDDLTQIIIDAGMQHMHDGFIVTEKGGYVGIGNGHDLLASITERKQAHLFFLAHYDALTGLPNRLLFHDRLDQACCRAQRNNQLMALMFLDLDRFKLINDTMGHSVGDKLLKNVATRLQGSVRKKDTVSRLGGDEFTIILEDLPGPQDAGVVARKILAELQKPLCLEGHEVVITSSIGIAIYPQNSENTEELQQNADAAMYHAKEKGKNNYQFFTPAMNQQVSARMSMEHQLRKALDNGQFLLHYQPLVSLGPEAKDRIIGLEALLRWQHPERGIVPPLEFIPLAEELGLMNAIGDYVLRTACAQNKAWQEELGVRLRVAVNLAGWQLEQTDFADRVNAILGTTGLDPSCLALEVTEDLLMQNIEQARTCLLRLGADGVQVAIDDFGTGYSSLSRLMNLPIHALKIDKCFIQSIGVQENGGTIAKAVIALARSLKLNVVAEGVETARQRDFLVRNGCDVIQGYFFCRPKPAAELPALLREYCQKSP